MIGNGHSFFWVWGFALIKSWLGYGLSFFLLPWLPSVHIGSNIRAAGQRVFLSVRPTHSFRYSFVASQRVCVSCSSPTNVYLEGERKLCSDVLTAPALGACSSSYSVVFGFTTVISDMRRQCSHPFPSALVLSLIQ